MEQSINSWSINSSRGCRSSMNGQRIRQLTVHWPQERIIIVTQCYAATCNWEKQYRRKEERVNFISQIANSIQPIGLYWVCDASYIWYFSKNVVVYCRVAIFIFHMWIWYEVKGKIKVDIFVFRFFEHYFRFRLFVTCALSINEGWNAKWRNRKSKSTFWNTNKWNL